ncbi:hypothetical protein, partial [Escherichia coli]|uniref:hypothetical protein n=1 Tax=Escherichia coli TaxID=562 RepID=UPI000932F936
TDRNRSHWSTSKTPSYTKSVSWQHHQKRQLIALNIVRKEMNKYQKSLNMPVWVDICSAGCDNRASFALFLIISRVKR